MDVHHNFATLQEFLSMSSAFQVEVNSKKVVARRQRKFAPRRGVFRLLLPHSLVIISPGKQPGQRANCLVRPDSLAIFMTVMLIGAIAVEILMDRATYPRDYPPGFIYGLTLYYVSVLIAEIIHTKKQLNQVLTQIK